MKSNLELTPLSDYLELGDFCQSSTMLHFIISDWGFPVPYQFVCHAPVLHNSPLNFSAYHF